VAFAVGEGHDDVAGDYCRRVVTFAVGEGHDDVAAR
jgi:hypothetical protein